MISSRRRTQYSEAAANVMSSNEEVILLWTGGQLHCFKDFSLFLPGAARLQSANNKEEMIITVSFPSHAFSHILPRIEIGVVGRGGKEGGVEGGEVGGGTPIQPTELLGADPIHLRTRLGGAVVAVRVRLHSVSSSDRATSLDAVSSSNFN